MQVRSSVLIWVFTLWFALLQAAAPLMHAHLNSRFDVDEDPHLHMSALHLQQEEPVNSQHAFHWHVHANQDSGMTVDLTPVMTEPDWSLPDRQTLWLFWLLLPTLGCMLAALRRVNDVPWCRFSHRRRLFHFITP